MLGLLVAPAPRPEFEALGSNFLEDKVSRNVSPFLVRGAVPWCRDSTLGGRHFTDCANSAG